MDDTEMIAGLAPVHPGELLNEIVLPALVGGKERLAHVLKLSLERVDEVLSGRQDLTPAMASALGEALGNGPDFWLRLQAQYDRMA